MDNHNHKKPTTKPTPTTISNRVDTTRHQIPTKTTTNNPTRHPTKPKTNSLSMSDTDDEFHSPLPSPIPVDDSKAIVPVENNNRKQPPPPPPPSMHMTVTAAYNRTARDEVVTGVAKLSPGGGGGGGEGGGGGGGRRRVRKDVMVERLGLGFRVMEMVLCLIAFSVMASDKTQGWSGDSFDRYREYRYVVAVNAIGFSYAAFQAIDMTYHLIHGKHIVSYHLRPHFDFIIDQILAYLLISASSSAATRVDDWVSNWGKDDFTQMATASIGMSFLAFIAFALSSIISGYNLCNQNSL